MLKGILIICSVLFASGNYEFRKTQLIGVAAGVQYLDFQKLKYNGAVEFKITENYTCTGTGCDNV